MRRNVGIKFMVIAHTPKGKVQHLVRADSADLARAKGQLAQPTAYLVEVKTPMGEPA